LSKCQIVNNDDQNMQDSSSNNDPAIVQNTFKNMNLSEESVKKTEKPRNYVDEDGWTVINRKKA